MKRFLVGTVAAIGAAVAISSAADAAVTITVNPTVTNYATDLLAVPDSQIIWDFDTIFTSGFSYSPGSATGVGSIPNTFLAPTGDTTVYGVVGPDNENDPAATFTSTKLMSSFSFLYGSPDFYNHILFSGPTGVIANLSGSDFGVPLGGQDIARRVTVNFGSSLVNQVTFTSGYNAFEFDRFSASVPEPATWAMMLLGFFGMGALLRSQRRNHALTVA